MTSGIWDGILGHEAVLRILDQAVNRPAPAYLFSGPDGLGKKMVAERFARRLLECPPERALDAHPDFSRLRRLDDAKEISIKQARELVGAMNLTSALGGRRAALIEEADRLSEEAANALLKAVEEPPPGVTYLFISQEPDRLPATLRSRLTLVPMSRLADEKVADFVEEYISKRNSSQPPLKLRGGEIEEIVRVSRGAPGVAARLLEDLDAWRSRQRETDSLLRVLNQESAGRQLAALDQFARPLESSADPDNAWHQALPELMRGTSDLFLAHPAKAVRLACALVHAWHLAGSSLSPRLALEWQAVRPYLIAERSIPFFLNPSYL